MTSTTRGVMPIARLDDVDLEVGPTTRRLRTAFEALPNLGV